MAETESGLEEIAEDAESQPADKQVDERTENEVAPEYSSQTKNKKNSKDDKDEKKEQEIEMLERWYSLKSGKNYSSSKKDSGSSSGENESKRQYGINLLERMLALSSGSSENIEEDVDSQNGALVLPYWKNKKTGRTEYLVEQPQLGKSEAGKIKFIGGHKKVRESYKEAAKRETGEEVSSPGREILLESDFEYYTTMYDMVNGQLTITKIYKCEIKSDVKWEMLKSSHGTHDAGILRNLDDKTFLGLIRDRYIAFGPRWEDMAKDLVRETSGLSSGIFPYASRINLESKIAYSQLKLAS